MSGEGAARRSAGAPSAAGRTRQGRFGWMDWLFAAGGPAAGGNGTRLVLEHLVRRAGPGAVDAEVRRLVAAALEPLESQPGTVWASLDWEHVSPVLVVRHVPRYLQLPAAPLSPEGVWAVDEQADELASLFAGGPNLTLQLPVSRPPEPEVRVPSVPGAEDLRGAQLMGSVATTLARAAETGTTTSEAAASAGASAAAGALATYRRRHGSSPVTAGDVAMAFAEFYNDAGADFFPVQTGDGRVALVNRSCPFGRGISGQPGLCNLTTALLGTLAAQVGGSAEVVLDEAIADGDARCRAVVSFAQSGSPWARRYDWPPEAASPPGGARADGFRVAMSLQLPRDSLSVSVLRHLVAHVLEEVGAVPEDRADVELAVSEAAANVIQHSGAGDAYDVVVSVGPRTAELRVVDIGRGFDHVLLSDAVAGPDEERGRGLALMHALVDQVRFSSEPERGTVVRLVKHLRFDDASPARRLMGPAHLGTTRA